MYVEFITYKIEMENIFKCPYVFPYPLKSSSCKLLKLDARETTNALVIVFSKMPLGGT
jgi:hypothetical protein